MPLKDDPQKVKFWARWLTYVNFYPKRRCAIYRVKNFTVTGLDWKRLPSVNQGRVRGQDGRAGSGMTALCSDGSCQLLATAAMTRGEAFSGGGLRSQIWSIAESISKNAGKNRLNPHKTTKCFYQLIESAESGMKARQDRILEWIAKANWRSDGDWGCCCEVDMGIGAPAIRGSEFGMAQAGFACGYAHQKEGWIVKIRRLSPKLRCAFESVLLTSLKCLLCKLHFCG